MGYKSSRKITLGKRLYKFTDLKTTRAGKWKGCEERAASKKSRKVYIGEGGSWEVPSFNIYYIRKPTGLSGLFYKRPWGNLLVTTKTSDKMSYREQGRRIESSLRHRNFIY